MSLCVCWPPEVGQVGYVLHGVDVLFNEGGGMLGISPYDAFAGQSTSWVMYSMLDTQAPDPADTYQIKVSSAGQGYLLSATATVPTVRYYCDNGSWWIEQYTDQAQQPQQMQAPIRVAHDVTLLLSENAGMVAVSPGHNMGAMEMSPVAVSEASPGAPNASLSTAVRGSGHPLDNILFTWHFVEIWEDGSLRWVGRVDR